MTDHYHLPNLTIFLFPDAVKKTILNATLLAYINNCGIPLNCTVNLKKSPVAKAIQLHTKYAYSVLIFSQEESTLSVICNSPKPHAGTPQATVDLQ